MKKMLIMGSSGMAGHVVYKYFSATNKYTLFDTSHSFKINDDTIQLDICDKKAVEENLHKIRPDYIINCIGVLIKGSNSNPENAIYINSYYPHQLERIANEIGAKLIHISTDCVFSGEKGAYSETDFKDGKDIYAQSKSLGEVVNEKDLTIRTSIIGPELKPNGEGLLHWFLSTNSKSLNGYTEAYWSGVTTLELAKAIEVFISQNITGLYHLTAPQKIAKFELLKVFKSIWNKADVEIIPYQGKKVDKSLVDTRKTLAFNVKSYDLMLKELYRFMNEHPEIYSQYKV